MAFARDTFPALALDPGRLPIDADSESQELGPVKAGQKIGSVSKPRAEPSAQLARLVAFRDRGVISEQAFLVQERRLMGAVAPRLPTVPARKKKRQWGKAL